MWNQRPSFRFEINNFSEKEAAISSKVFVSGGCEWYLNVHPKGDRHTDDRLSLYLYVANRKSLRTGWRSAGLYFVLLNQSEKELYRSSITSHVFSAEHRAWGFPKTLPLSKFQEKGILENDILIIDVYIKIVEAVDGKCIEKEAVDINGFQVLPSQVTSVNKIFKDYPDIAKDFKPKIQVVKTTYINVLLNLIETIDKPSQNHSETELRNAHNELRELTKVGFKLDWLKLKLEEVYLERKKANTDGSRVQQLEEHLKNLELTVSVLKVELDKEKTWTRKRPNLLCLFYL